MDGHLYFIYNYKRSVFLHLWPPLGPVVIDCVWWRELSRRSWLTACVLVSVFLFPSRGDIDKCFALASSVCQFIAHIILRKPWRDRSISIGLGEEVCGIGLTLLCQGNNRAVAQHLPPPRPHFLKNVLGMWEWFKKAAFHCERTLCQREELEIPVQQHGSLAKVNTRRW